MSDAVTLPIGASVYLIDAQDEAAVRSVRWSDQQINGLRYAVAYGGKDRPNLYLHRFVAGATKGQIVDHISGDTLDCRRSNLRITDRLGNGRNRKPAKGRRFKGTTLRESGKFQARLATRGEYFSLGRFATEEEAARAYDRKALEVFGEFARLNFPEERLVPPVGLEPTRVGLKGRCSTN